ncbi:MAG: AraC family transcriptional regulator [Spirochaetaceae bacterium]|nr:MAG: AraC family transcriptional regulator [Spirochaetaceae bacterium]
MKPMRVRVNSAARFFCAPDWNWDTSSRGFADWDLWVVLGGTGVLRTGAERFPLARGDTFVLRPRTRYRVSHDPSQPLHVVAVHHDRIADAAVSSAPSTDPFHRRVVPIEFLAGILDRIIRFHLRGSGDEADAWLTVALTERASADQPQPATGAAARIAELCTQIRERPGDRWTLGTIASLVGASPQHVSRLFKQSVGTSPSRYVRDVRIATAKAYLRGSSLPLKRIASILGYHDEFHFSNQFRSATGVRPSEFRASV